MSTATLMVAPRVPCPSEAGHCYGPDYPPSPKQMAYLIEDCREALYGGAAGGGKTDALLRAALQYACIPGYAALLVRQTHPQLAMEGGMIERAQEWLAGTDAKYNVVEKRWDFPSGASLTFMHMERDAHRFKIQGAEFQYIGFDELTNWKTDKVYRFAAARLRKPQAQERLQACPTCGMTLADVPLRMRAGTNPGSAGEAWVHRRFVQPWEEAKLNETDYVPEDQKFLPAFVHDNPGLDEDEYQKSLSILDDMTKEQLRDGTWGLRINVLLHRERIRVVQREEVPTDLRLVRAWDFAATEAENAEDPDWTVGALLGEKDGRWWLLDIVRRRVDPGGVETLFLDTLLQDRNLYGQGLTTVLEREPGSSGKITSAHFMRMASGFAVSDMPHQSSKTERARPLAGAIDNGNYHVVAAAWTDEWLDEAALFPDGSHDDQVDAVTTGMAYLSQAVKRGGLRFR